MEPHSAELQHTDLEPPKDYLLSNNAYVDTVITSIDQEPEKKTHEYISKQLSNASDAGEIDDVLSPGRNITSLLRVADHLNIGVPATDQWAYYHKGHTKQIEIFNQKSKTDPDGAQYYDALVAQAQSKALEIEATFEKHGLSVNEVLSSKEDEFVAAVQAVAVRGEFPNGLQLKRKMLCEPGPKRGFATYSDSGFTLSNNSKIRAARGMFSQESKSTALNAPHVLTVLPYVPNNYEIENVPLASDHQSGYSVLVYHTLLDGTQTDATGRDITNAETYFLMPTGKANELINVIESSENGADIFENFVQKAAPDVMAKDSNSSGVRRAPSDGLFVLDDKLRREILPDEVIFNESSTYSKIQALLKSQNRVPVLKYSQPVGVVNE